MLSLLVLYDDCAIITEQEAIHWHWSSKYFASPDSEICEDGCVLTTLDFPDLVH